MTDLAGQRTVLKSACQWLSNFKRLKHPKVGIPIFLFLEDVRSLQDTLASIQGTLMTSVGLIQGKGSHKKVIFLMAVPLRP